jgi:hypothetical protein
MKKQDKYTRAELGLWELQVDREKGRHWATAAISPSPWCGLTSASVSAHPRSSLVGGSILVSVHGGTDYLDDSIGVNLSGDPGSQRLIDMVGLIPDLNEDIRQWVIDRIGAVPTVLAKVVRPALEQEATP